METFVLQLDENLVILAQKTAFFLCAFLSKYCDGEDVIINSLFCIRRTHSRSQKKTTTTSHKEDSSKFNLGYRTHFLTLIISELSSRAV